MLKTVQVTTADDMERLGGSLSARCQPGCIITLQGEIGAGKTTWIRGFLRARGHTGTVTSPTYILVNDYLLNKIRFYHFDLYRLNTLAELDAIGLEDYFDRHSICLIEWPEKAKGRLPEADIAIDIQHQNTARAVTLSSHTKAGDDMLALPA